MTIAFRWYSSYQVRRASIILEPEQSTPHGGKSRVFNHTRLPAMPRCYFAMPMPIFINADAIKFRLWLPLGVLLTFEVWCWWHYRAYYLYASSLRLPLLSPFRPRGRDYHFRLHTYRFHFDNFYLYFYIIIIFGSWWLICFTAGFYLLLLGYFEPYCANTTKAAILLYGEEDYHYFLK